MINTDYSLTNLLSAAGATIGIIIVGTIFLQFMSTKAIELTGRYRDLTAEYRGIGGEEARHDRLQVQIRIYRRRLQLMTYASCLASVAMLCLLSAMLAGGLSVLFPKVAAIKVVGTGGLFFGLGFIACAVALEMAENLLSRHELGEEVGDLDEAAQGIGL